MALLTCSAAAPEPYNDVPYSTTCVYHKAAYVDIHMLITVLSVMRSYTLGRGGVERRCGGGSSIQTRGVRGIALSASVSLAGVGASCVGVVSGCFAYHEWPLRFVNEMFEFELRHFKADQELQVIC